MRPTSAWPRRRSQTEVYRHGSGTNHVRFVTDSRDRVPQTRGLRRDFRPSRFRHEDERSARPCRWSRSATLRPEVCGSLSVGVQPPGNRLMGRLWTAKAAAALIAATPGRLIRICPSVPASSSSISWSWAAMSTSRVRYRARSRPSRAARCSASAGGGRQPRQRPTQYSAVARVNLPEARAVRDLTVGPGRRTRPHRPAPPDLSGTRSAATGPARRDRPVRTGPGTAH